MLVRLRHHLLTVEESSQLEKRPLCFLVSLFLALLGTGHSHRVGLHIGFHLELGTSSANLGEIASEAA
jgi:hypothetical protein